MVHGISIGRASEFVKASEKQFRRNVETSTKAFDLVFVWFSLAVENLRDDARGSKFIHQMFLFQIVLLHEKAENIQRLGPRQTIPLFFEVLDQECQKFSKVSFSWGERLMPLIEFVEDLGVGFVLLLRTNDLRGDFLEQG
jgi:hypothetical protein